MLLAWSDDLVTGNAAIDNQHKQLVKAVNDLMSACSGGHGKEQVNATMKFLVDYTVKHFGDEEKLQQQYHYPDYINHKKHHEYFKGSVSELAKQLQTNGPTVTMVTKLSSSVGDWLVSHIRKEDKKVAAHINKQAALV